MIQMTILITYIGILIKLFQYEYEYVLEYSSTAYEYYYETN